MNPEGLSEEENSHDEFSSLFVFKESCSFHHNNISFSRNDSLSRLWRKNTPVRYFIIKVFVFSKHGCFIFLIKYIFFIVYTAKE